MRPCLNKKEKKNPRTKAFWEGTKTVPEAQGQKGGRCVVCVCGGVSVLSRGSQGKPKVHYSVARLSDMGKR